MSWLKQKLNPQDVLYKGEDWVKKTSDDIIDKILKNRPREDYFEEHMDPANANNSGFGIGKGDALARTGVDAQGTRVFISEYDEPTYLTFKVNFGGPNTARESYGIASFAYKDEETYAANLFKTGNYDFMPHPLLVSKSFDVMGARDALTGTGFTSYSTYKYLMDINEARRAEKLIEFQKGLHELQTKYQYYFQSLNGIADIVYGNKFDGQRVRDGGKLTITCLPSLDQKVKYLMSLYRQICWDETFQRWILPDMMRFFKLYIYISEIRQFHRPYALTDKESENLELSDGRTPSDYGFDKYILNAVNDIMPVTCIECSMCEFDIDNKLFQQSYTINDDNAENVKIKIKVGKTRLYERYNVLVDNDTGATQGFIDEVILNYRDRNLQNADVVNVVKKAQELGILTTNNFNDRDEETPIKRLNPWVANIIKWGINKGINVITDYAEELLTRPIIRDQSILDMTNVINSQDPIVVIGMLDKILSPGKYLPNDKEDKEFARAQLEKVLTEMANNNKVSTEETKNLQEIAKKALEDQSIIDEATNIPDEELIQMLIDSNKLHSNKPEDFELDGALHSNKPEDFELGEMILDTTKDSMDLPSIEKGDKPKDIELEDNIVDATHDLFDLPDNIVNIIKKQTELSDNIVDAKHEDFELEENKGNPNKIISELDENKLGLDVPDAELDENKLGLDVPDAELEENKGNPNKIISELDENKLGLDVPDAELDENKLGLDVPDAELEENINDVEIQTVELEENKSIPDKIISELEDNVVEATNDMSTELETNKTVPDKPVMDISDNKPFIPEVDKDMAVELPTNKKPSLSIADRQKKDELETNKLKSDKPKLDKSEMDKVVMANKNVLPIVDKDKEKADLDKLLHKMDNILGDTGKAFTLTENKPVIEKEDPIELPSNKLKPIEEEEFILDSNKLKIVEEEQPDLDENKTGLTKEEFDLVMNKGVPIVDDFDMDENSKDRGTQVKDPDLDKPIKTVKAIPFELMKNKAKPKTQDFDFLDKNDKPIVDEGEKAYLEKNKPNAKSSINDEEKIKHNRYDKFNE